MQQDNQVLNVFLSILLFPTLFQKGLIEFCQGNLDPVWLMIVKWIFLMIPCLVFIGACWLTIVSLITVIFRQNRKPFVVALIITWWDYFKATLTFWGGVFRFLLTLIYTLIGLLKIVIITLWTILRDVLFLPVRLIYQMARGISGSSVPYIAVVLTLLAALTESLVFTAVMTPVVVDIIPQFNYGVIQVALFLMLSMFVLASYAVLSITMSTVKEKKVGNIIFITLIELIVIFVEVIFLYREFVDALVPWFSQYVPDFELGVLGTIGIAFIVWIGVRSLVWFLFASHGAPVIMAIIQGQPLPVTNEKNNGAPLKLFESSESLINAVKKNASWIQNQGDALLNQLILPPLQVIGAGINFLILLITSRHMFELPFVHYSDIKPSAELIALLSDSRKPDSTRKTSARPHLLSEDDFKSGKEN